MEKHIRAMVVLLAFGPQAVPAGAQNHYRDFTVATDEIQGAVQGLMNGNPDPGPPPRTSFTFTVLPHSYMAFAVK